MGSCLSRPPAWRTSKAVITLVTLAMGRSVAASRLHRTWPVAASTRIAPLAFTPAGAPATVIAGRTDSDGDGRGAADAPTRAATAGGDAVRRPGRAEAAVHAVAPPTTAATTIGATSRVLSRMTPSSSSVVTRRHRLPREGRAARYPVYHRLRTSSFHVVLPMTVVARRAGSAVAKPGDGQAPLMRRRAGESPAPRQEQQQRPHLPG